MRITRCLKKHIVKKRATPLRAWDKVIRGSVRGSRVAGSPSDFRVPRRTVRCQPDRQGSSLERVLALMTGFDGDILPKFELLLEWLAVHSKASRQRLSEIVPSGMIYTGDARNYSVDEKRNILKNLRRESNWNPWCSRCNSPAARNRRNCQSRVGRELFERSCWIQTESPLTNPT